MKKRLIAALLTLVLLFSSMPVSVFAAEDTTTTLTVDGAYAMPGSTVTVNVDIAGNPGILGATLTATWDDGLKLIDSTNGVAFSELTFQAPSRYTSGCNFVWYGSTVSEVIDGTVLVLTFEVSEAAEDAEVYAVEITYDSRDILDENYNEVELSVTNGSVRIITYTPGDVTGDDRINPLDLIKLSQYISDGCVTNPDGFNIIINESAADVNDDGRMNPLDLILISRYISDGCKTDPNGYNIVLKPSTPKCSHTMQVTEAKDATCTEEGNIAYWYCSACEKYFFEETAKTEISLKDTIIVASHNLTAVEAKSPSYTEEGNIAYWYCSACKKYYGDNAATAEITQEETVIPKLQEKEYLIEYDVKGTHTYLKNVDIKNTNPTTYTASERILLDDLSVEGYSFNGWYDAPQSASTYNRISEIPVGSTGKIKLYAHWTEDVYNITYNVYKTPIEPIGDEYKSYKISEGLISGLPNPEIYNYVFLGWYTEDGKEVTSIPAGTTGHLTLNAYWTSKRNLTKAVPSLGDPIVVEDIDDGVIYFTYELGRIENVPLSDAIWTIQSVSGLAQQKSETVSTTISEEKAKEVAETISNTTVDSGTWTLSKDWNDVTEVNEAWAKENGMTQEEANEITKSESGTFSFTSSKGGCDTTTTTDGTTTVTYESQNYVHGNSAEFNARINASYSNEGNLTSKIAGTYKIDGEVGGGYEQHKETNEHSGKDTTEVLSTVTANNTSWNKASTKSKTKAASESTSIKNALSSIISNTKGYGKSYSAGGENSESQGFSATDSKSVNTSSTLTYFTSETKTTTTTYSTDGKSEGCYRLVIAGTVHVFGVVGYDVATQSYFAYTYNVLDDKTYEFLDYSPTNSFSSDDEKGVLPFEVPYEVHEYVADRTVSTEGLEFITNSSSGTAIVSGYKNDAETDVIIPSYFTSGGAAYRVTGISANAFAGKPIEAIILSDYIKEIPAGAFKDCSSLKQVSGYFTIIGDEAFSGCTALEDFVVSSATTQIGADAFKDVPTVTVKALSADSAISKAKMDLPNETEVNQITYAQKISKELVNAAVNSGAQNILLDISNTIDGADFTVEVGAINSLELLGSKRTYDNLRIKSDANTTILRKLTIGECNRIPLEISSKNLFLEVVNIESPGYALLLSNDAANITLLRDNNLVSSAGEAIVCKTPNIISQSVNQVAGTLTVSGNVYVNGTEESINVLKQNGYLSVTNGEIIQLSDEDYAQYIKGAFNVTFDANGGSIDETTRVVFCGTEIGTLPVPARLGYNFDGWFTSDDSQVFENTKMTGAADITLYAKWTIRSFNLNFDANGGSVGETTRIVEYNQPYGTLPTPTRDYYTFNGWYTSATEGTEVTAENIMATLEDVTIYAHWTHNPVSGWVKSSEMPSGAEVINQKWSYTETTKTESKATSLAGYTQTGSYWVHSGDGSKEYSTAFPGGFDTSHWIYTSFAKEPYSAYENTTNKRDVTNVWAGYVYWHWMYDCGGSNGTSKRPIMNTKDYGVDGFYYKYFGAFTSTNGNYESTTSWCNNKGITNYVIPERTAYADCQGSTRWFRFDYYVSYYSDYYKIFQYQKVENKESSTEISASSTISNVQKWVQYRAK